MNRPARLIPLATLLLLLTASPSWAVPRDAVLLLTVSPTAISFTAQDPDFFPTLQANQTVSILSSTSGLGGQPYWLTIRARGDLITAGATIPISAVTWQTVKTGGDNKVVFTSGTQTLSSTTDVRIMEGKGNDQNPQAAGIMTFFVQNLWTQAAGTYTQTADLTLSSP
jgi:hypothetical protein